MAGQTPFNAQNAVISTNGGIYSALALPAGQNLVKAAPGRVFRLIINTAGTAGTLAINDAASVGAVAASNLVFTALNTTAAGNVYNLEFPCANGIVVTVPTAGVVSVSYV